MIAEILNQFDLIALVELRDDLSDLHEVMKILGPFWKIVFCDARTDAAGNRERVGYLYDKRMAVFTGLGNYVELPEKFSCFTAQARKSRTIAVPIELEQAAPTDRTNPIARAPLLPSTCFID